MQSIQSEHQEVNNQQLSFTKMFQESSIPPITPSAAFLAHLPEKTFRSSHQGENGQTLVVCLDPKEQSRGGSWMPNTSLWPNDANVCLLSQVLEKGSIPQKYFLSRTAKDGILRRAESRGKVLPPLLKTALEN